MESLSICEKKEEERLKLRSFLNSVLKDAMTILEAESGSVFLFDADKKELVLDSYCNSHTLTIADIKRQVGEGVSGKVVEIRKPVLVRDIDVDPRFHRNGFNHYHTKSFISVPLICNDMLIGLVNVADKASGEPFSEKDLKFASTICKYACVIAENMINSDREQTEKEKLARQRELLEKYASVGKLAAGVVHEVNNPLDGIIRYTNILMGHIEDNSVAKEYLFEIKKGLNRIGKITRSLLEFSHHVNNGTRSVKNYVDIHGLIDEALDILKTKFNGNIEIVKKYDPNLGALLDLGLSHAFTNIIKNALDAMPEGGILSIVTWRQNSDVCISFRDSGVGIPEELLERIFEPFFSTKSSDKGTGLGLSICREIINKYEGSIRVESCLGKGCAFTIFIPDKYLKNGK